MQITLTVGSKGVNFGADYNRVLKRSIELFHAAGGKFAYEEFDPTTDEVVARQVEARYGVAPMSLGFFSEGSFYLYAVLEVGDRSESLILTDQDLTAAAVREAVENSLRRHTPGFLKTIGVSAPEPLQLPPQLAMQMPQPPPEFEEIKRFLGQDYQVKSVLLDSPDGIDTDVDILLVLKPQNLDEFAIYNLDQYLMRGGRVVLCVSNFDANFSRQL